MSSPNKPTWFRGATVAAAWAIGLMLGVVADRVATVHGDTILAKMAELGESPNTLNCGNLSTSQIIDAFRTKWLSEEDLSVIEESIYLRYSAVIGQMADDRHFTAHWLTGEYFYDRERRALFGKRLSNVLVQDAETQEIIAISCAFVDGDDVKVPDETVTYHPYTVAD